MRALIVRAIRTVTSVEIVIESDYTEAAQMVAGGGYDCALIAFNFATNAGYNLVKKLREMGVATKLVLMSTADMTAESKIVGADAFILKTRCTSEGLRELFTPLDLL